MTDNIINIDSQKDISNTIPANFHAEQMFLGAIIINSDLSIRVDEFLQPDHFYESLHQKIYSAIQILIDKGIVVSHVTLKSMLEREPLYKEVNGDEYLIKLTTLAITVINPYDYARIIYDLAIKRNLITLCENILNDSRDSTLEQTAIEHIELAEQKLFQLAGKGVHDKGFVSIKESIKIPLAKINNRDKSDVFGISTGINKLDETLSGFRNSDLIILAGRPGMGKTAFALNFAINAANALEKKTKEGHVVPSVGIFSLEMSTEQLNYRMISMGAKVNSQKLLTDLNDEEDYNSVQKSIKMLKSKNIFIDDTPNLSIASIRARARHLKHKHNLSILFVDYLQLLSGTCKRDNRVLEISEITRGLKVIAKELDIPVIALSQLSRAVEQRADKRPTLSDLRESGSIEQDADIVLFLYSQAYYLKLREPADQESDEYSAWFAEFTKVQNSSEIIIAKHRNGATGNVEVKYIPAISLVGNL